MSLPPDFQSAIDRWLTDAGPRGGRRAGTESLSATYRAGGSSRHVDLAAYLVARLPATHAAVARVLAELGERRPDFAPESLLDAGSGPGTASWAAAGRWPGLRQVTFLDDSPEFLALAAALSRDGPEPLCSARALGGRIESLPDTLQADLVIAAYALAELPRAAVASAAERLWRASRQLLALVEPGTPEGFARIRLAREALLAQGAVPVAPCTHAAACPVTGEDWCHFSVRLARSRAHMHAKGASVPFEDERFAYLILARDGAPSGGARLAAPPVQAKPGVTLRLCTAGRIEARHVARRESAAYKSVRKLGWGDLLAPEPAEKDETP